MSRANNGMSDNQNVNPDAFDLICLDRVKTKRVKSN